ncbi:hypothetical protein GPJ56_009446 [Histomonas meleagridis]|uniref:uncharacterized protein n=1 Tax=Histomonas meleagridis TaxID=135588 RepID=UPI00355A4E07|nr:hypothetical protein GPJ56_009446 [Histomonas meleagridis]KAH0800343.1 hypothetical protein GO595_006932 [Histomonas meleagridis]
MPTCTSFSFIFEISILLASTVLFGTFLLISYNNAHVLTHEHCPTHPTLNFTNTIEELHQMMIDLINKSQTRVIATITYTNWKRVLIKYVDVFKSAHNRGVDVQLIIFNSGNRGVEKYLIENGIDFYTMYDYQNNSTIKAHVEFDSLIIDDDVYLVPLLFSQYQPKIGTVLSFHKCPVATNDVKSFIEFLLLGLNGQLPDIIPQYMYASSSANKPTLVGDSSFYFHHTPDNLTYPLRAGTTSVILDLFSQYPDELLIFTKYTPLVPYEQHRLDSGQLFSYYIQLRALVSSNRTKVKILVSDDCELEYINFGLMSYPTFEMRMYNSTYEGPHYFITKKEGFLFSCQVTTNFLRNFYSLHFRSDSKEFRDKLKAHFDYVWNRSVKMQLKWE